MRAESNLRAGILNEVAERILSLKLQHPVRVAVDGRTASGKTSFADELGERLEGAGVSVIRASVDGFHRPAAARHAKGRLSPDGYYEDSRDWPAISKLLLEPLGPDGDRWYVTATFDLYADVEIGAAPRRASRNSILIVDGTFLQRPELRARWDFVIFLRVSKIEASRRGIERDSQSLGGEDVAAELYGQRYGPAFTRYELECRPENGADVVIDNSMFASAFVCGS